MLRIPRDTFVLFSVKTKRTFSFMEQKHIFVGEEHIFSDAGIFLEIMENWIIRNENINFLCGYKGQLRIEIK